MGAVIPLIQRTSPPPAPIMVTFVLPEFVRVWVRSTPLPSGTLPKLILVGLALRKPLVKPVPLTPMCPKGVAEPELTNVKPPLTIWLSLGVKTILKETVFPAPRVNGVAKPSIANPGAYFRMEEMVTGSNRVLVRATVKVLDCDTLTLPKANEDGAARRE